MESSNNNSSSNSSSRKSQLPPIPAKRYFTIGEVSELCGVKPHVLRYWEQEFPQLKPVKQTSLHDDFAAFVNFCMNRASRSAVRGRGWISQVFPVNLLPVRPHFKSRASSSKSSTCSARERNHAGLSYTLCYNRARSSGRSAAW